VFDLDGCLYVSDRAVPGAREAVDAVSGRGMRVVVATNNSTRPVQAVAERLFRVTGIQVSPARVVTSGRAALLLLGDGDTPALVVGEQGLRDTLTAGSLELTDDPAAARAVVVGLDRRFDYERLRVAMEAVMRGARFVATNGDATFPTGGMPVPGAGAIVAALERATGVAPEYAGKPYPAMHRAVESILGDGPTWIVGDRVDTDVAMGKAAGWRTVLVLTGVSGGDDEIPPDMQPDHVLESVADLPEILPTADSR
jgi:4-nitrophenyl phosphatase